MNESRSAWMRSFIEGVARAAHPRPPATEAQIAAFEKTLGLRLPDELRAFLVEVGDGVDLKNPYGVLVLPLFEEGSSSSARLVAFPIRPFSGPNPPTYVKSRVDNFNVRNWGDLSGHEQMQSEVALHFATGRGEVAFLVLSGPQRGRVWFGPIEGRQGLPFFEALYFLLGTCERSRILSVGSRSGRLLMRPPATWEQLEGYEKTIGLRLPDELRAFVCQVADGFEVGYDVSMELFTLFGDIPSYSSDIRPRPVVFPVQQLLRGQGVDPPSYPIAGTKYARGWNELSGHEKAESDVALHFGMLQGEEVILVLSGPQRGSVWFTSRFGGLAKSTAQGITFLKALDFLLSECQ